MKRIIYGVHPVEETINFSGNNINIIYYLPQSDRKLSRIIDQARNKKIEVKEIDKESIENICKDGNHQGIVAITGEYPYLNEESLIESSIKKQKSDWPPLFVILDEIQDVGNLGSIIRSSVAFGVDGIIHTKHRTVTVTPAVVRISSGASERIKIAKATNLANLLDYLSSQDIITVGLDMQGDIPISEVPLNLPVAIVLGNEHRGLKRLVKEKCKYLAKIPQRGTFDSLNVAVSCAVALYEINRKRLYSSKTI